MTFNPYAPPEDHADLPQQAGPDGAAQAWTVEEVLRLGWDQVKQHWPALVLGPVIAGVIGAVPGQIIQTAGSMSRDKDIALATMGVSLALGMVLQTFFQGGLLKLGLAAARGQRPELGDIFKGASTFGRLLALKVLVFLAVLAGTLALIVPGVIVGLGFSQAQYYVVDANMGPIEAMGASWQATKGYRLQLFGYGWAAFLVMMIGFLACCVGMLPAMALVQVASAIIYTRISGRTGMWSTPSPYGMPGYMSQAQPPGADPMRPGWGP